MPPTKDETARELAAWHFKVEPHLTKVVRFLAENENAEGEPIKLLEVNAATVSTGSVEPFAFAPSESVPFRTVIAEVSPEEFERIERKEMPLPPGWSLAHAQSLVRSAA